MTKSLIDGDVGKERQRGMIRDKLIVKERKRDMKQRRRSKLGLKEIYKEKRQTGRQLDK